MENKLDGLDQLKDLLCSDGRIHINEREGAKFDHDGLHIGLRVGPRLDVGGVTHEIAHFVEMEDERLLSRPKNWGFQYAEIEVYGRMCYNFTTSAATLREIRTIAYQYNLEHHLHINEQTPYEAIDSLIYMPDFWNVPYDKEVEKQLQDSPPRYQMASDKARLKWCEEKLIEFINMERYSYDNFMKELERKKRLLL